MALIMAHGIPSPAPYVVRMPTLDSCHAKVIASTADLANETDHAFTFVAGCRVVVSKSDPA